MNRRSFCAGMAASFIAPLPVGADSPKGPVFQNGTLMADGTLRWSDGGGASLQERFVKDGFREALAIGRLNLSQRERIMIRNALLTRPDGDELINLDTQYRGKILPGAMISGDGFISINPTVVTDEWTRKLFICRKWWVTVPQGDNVNHRWEVYVPAVCNNITLVPLDSALACVCDPGRDAYPRS